MVFKSLFGRKKGATGGIEVGGTKELLHLTKSVDLPVDKAFALFIDELQSWWPKDYTWGKDKLTAIGVEPKMGGTCYEESDQGRQTWGTVLAVQRPSHLVLAWQIDANRAFEPKEAQASRVDIRFTPNQEGGTDVLLVHRDFFRHGDGWEQYRSQMASDKGWPYLINLYAEAARNR